MGLGERCDEIVRLIDETLAAVGADGVDTPPDGTVPADTGPRLATVATVTPFPASALRPERAASGF